MGFILTQGEWKDAMETISPPLICMYKDSETVLFALTDRVNWREETLLIKFWDHFTELKRHTHCGGWNRGHSYWILVK